MNLVNISVTMDALLALWTMRGDDNETTSQTILRLAGLEKPETATAARILPPSSLAAGKFSYEILGDKRRAKSSVDAYLDILVTLSRLEPKLPERLSLVARANTRNHIARSPAEVYPTRSDLGRKAREFASGWYAGINLANREKTRILRLACSILRLQFGRDIVF
jgi:hypothetical protein